MAKISLISTSPLVGEVATQWRVRGSFYIVFFLLLLCSPIAHAQTEDRYPFPTVRQQQQFQRLITQLRCLVCQNQDLADSNADLAKDLKRQVYEMVLANKTDAEIKQYLTARYGDFVLFKPPFNPQTMVLWLLPFILLAVGFFLLWRLTSSRKKSL